MDRFDLCTRYGLKDISWSQVTLDDPVLITSLSLKSPNVEVNLIAGHIPLDYTENPQHASNPVIKITRLQLNGSLFYIISVLLFIKGIISLLESMTQDTMFPLSGKINLQTAYL